jgi:hypothetical protein
MRLLYQLCINLNGIKLQFNYILTKSLKHEMFIYYVMVCLCIINQYQTFPYQNNIGVVFSINI